MQEPLFLSLFSEEVLHQLPAFFLQDTALHNGFRVEGLWSEAMESAFLVLAAIDNALHLCPADGSSAHHAGFHGDVERAVGQILPSQVIGSGSDGLHLGMCRHIAQRLRQIVSAGNDPFTAHHHGTDGDSPRCMALWASSSAARMNCKSFFSWSSSFIFSCLHLFRYVLYLFIPCSNPC